jgi:hypothetical protein
VSGNRGRLVGAVQIRRFRRFQRVHSAVLYSIPKQAEESCAWRAESRPPGDVTCEEEA